MKQSEKNEVDLLLRKLARGEQSSRSGAGDEFFGTEHLDADELNSFAEDVLPPAARARYTAHLADCAGCRKLVTQLTITAGATVAQKPGHELSHKSFWQAVAAFFSPAVLRYAVPALALIAIVGIGMIVFRQQRNESGYVAQIEPRRVTEPAIVKNNDSQDSETNAAPDQQTRMDDTKPKPASEASGPTEKTKEQAGGSGVGGADAAKAEANAPPPAPQAGVAQPAYAPEPKVAAVQTAPQPEPSEVGRVNTEATVKAKEQQAEKDEALRREDEGARVARDRSSTRRVQGLSAVTPSPSKKTDTSEAKDNKQSTEERRTVAGRQFRREGDSWIDTAFDGNSSVANIKRGSEQYRALIADEPQLKTIAESLSGTVLVVWKGRAYRFL